MKRLATTSTVVAWKPHNSNALNAAGEWGPAMDHVGIDVHRKESQVCILTPSGEVTEVRIATTRERVGRHFTVRGVTGAARRRGGERGWDGFSVQTLCERADVGRSTFYMHFADKEEVLAGAFADLGREVRAQLARSGAARPLGFSRGLLDHAQEHLRVFRAMVGRRSSHLAQGKMRDLVLELVREDMAGLLPPGARREGTAAFLAGAFFRAAHLVARGEAPDNGRAG
jgi:AcrR family transcriptional regulator